MLAWSKEIMDAADGTMDDLIRPAAARIETSGNALGRAFESNEYRASIAAIEDMPDEAFGMNLAQSTVATQAMTTRLRGRIQELLSSDNGVALMQSDDVMSALQTLDGKLEGLRNSVTPDLTPQMRDTGLFDANGTPILEGATPEVKYLPTREQYKAWLTARKTFEDAIGGVDNATASILKGLKEEVNDFVYSWGEAGALVKTNVEAYGTFLRARDALRGKSFGERYAETPTARPVIKGKTGNMRFEMKAIMANIKAMATPEGQGEVAFWNNQLNRMEEAISQHPGVFAEPEQLLASIQSLRKEVLDARNTAVIKHATDIIFKNAAIPKNRWQYTVALLAGTLWGGLPAYAVGRAGLAMREALSNPFTSAKVLDALTKKFVSTQVRVATAGKAVGVMLASTERAATLPRSRVGLLSAAIFNPEGTRKETHAQFETIRTRLLELDANPQLMSDTIGHATQMTSVLNEQLSTEMARSMAAIQIYLHAQLPPRRLDPFSPGKEAPNSPAEEAAFLRKVRVATDPYIILELLAERKLTMGDMDVLHDLHPKAYVEQASTVLKEVAMLEGKISYQARMQLATLFSIPPEEASFLDAMQNVSAQTPQQAQAVGATGRPVSQPAALEQTSYQALQSKG